ncbi:FAD-binding oxidoreductase [Streptomyces samsunensis]|uniref:NAD(P)/FAD-dependent oxidoreductase n=1 Tax=Streptomyces malaysiensis TaxID=92644 RepID=UPI0015841638|nr:MULTISPECIES: FAD-dependent oxidoreductase [Streptomyces]NUH39686.1 FAD-binding oxidoreductase [Streptomyces samsunensis]WHX15817.1 FAD-dependent oxidoreductase [Streptomyces sp. NA07423]
MTDPVHRTDVAVVGAGVVGTAVFHELASRGARVTLVERDRAGLGTTAWSGAIVRCHHDDPVLSDRAAAGWRYFRDFAQHTGEPAAFHTGGFLYLPAPDRAAGARAEAARLGAQLPVTWLEAEEVTKHFGHLLAGPAGRGAVWEPESGWLDPAEVTHGFLRAGRRRGGTVLEGVAVHSLMRAGDGRITGVRTSAGAIRADRVVLATGAATAHLLTSWGLAHDLWAQAVQVELFRPEAPVSGQPAYTDDEFDINGRPDPDSGGVYVGHPTYHRLPSPPGREQMDAAQSRLAAAAGARRWAWLPGSRHLGGLRAAECWAPGGRARVTAHPDAPALLLATGFNGGGFKMAPWAAAEIARLAGLA